MPDDALVAPTEQFVAAVAGMLERIDRVATDRAVARDHRTAAAAEALQIAAAVIAADSLVSDLECAAVIRAFKADLEIVGANPDPTLLRATDLFHRARPWFLKPSRLAKHIFGASAGNGSVGDGPTIYFYCALEYAHAVASIDADASLDELNAIARFRHTLLEGALDAGVRIGTENEIATQLAPARSVAPESLEAVLAELDALVGMTPVKQEVHLIASLARIQKLRAERGLKLTDTSRHLVFSGNPGTGKTTVARLIARIFHSLGYLDKGHLVETDRSGLVAGFVGQTATKVRDVFDKAQGGVLLIDEAYALARGNDTDFGREAIDTIVKLSEDRRDNTIVVLTGYTDEMDDLIASNPGMESRFPRAIHFPDYADAELVEIFDRMCVADQYQPDQSARAALHSLLVGASRGRGFGNARFIRNSFEEALGRQAVRLQHVASPTNDDLVLLTGTDIPAPGWHEDTAKPLDAASGTTSG